MAIRNALDIYSYQAELNARAGQESINPEVAPAEMPVANPPRGQRMMEAGVLTVVIGIFLFGLISALGYLTGETLFRRVEAAV